jgi:Ca-activated chloride channel homolog
MMPSRRHLVAALALAYVASSSPLAQSQVFRASTDMVFLSVTATENSRAAAGLNQEDFTVFEDGRPQEIEVFSREPQPIALSLLLDASDSMTNRMGMAAEAAIGFVRRMRPGDEAQVVAFNNTTNIRQAFTTDHALLEQAIRSTRTDGSTSLYTALYIAFNELDRVGRAQGEEIRRQAVVLLSDGEDTSSLLGYEEVLERARHSDVVVFAVGLRDDVRTNTARSSATSRSGSQYDYALRTLAQTTGGRVFFADAAAQLPAIYNQIADELSSQYTIGYTSRNTNRDGRWRQLSIRVGKPGVVARTRAGYFGPTRIP